MICEFDENPLWDAHIGDFNFYTFLGLFGVSGLISSFPDLDCRCGLATALFGSTRCTGALLASSLFLAVTA